jgi:microcystin-dependent protein
LACYFLDVAVLPDPPDFVTPGQPVEAVWGNDVVAWVREAVAAVQTMMPIGVVCPYGGTSEPINWLFCRGQAVSQTTYSALYAVVGSKFDQGVGAAPAGTFHLPNIQGRYPVGVNVGSSIGMGAMWSGGGVGEISGSYTPALAQHVHAPHDHVFDFSHDHGTNNETLSFLMRADRYNGDGNTIPWPQDPETGEQMAWRDRTSGVDGPAGPVRATSASGSGLVSGTPVDGNQVPPGVSFNFIIKAL